MKQTPKIVVTTTEKGNAFRDAVAALLRTASQQVIVETQIGSQKVDIYCVSRTMTGRAHRLAVECKDYATPLQKTQVDKIDSSYRSLYESDLVDEILIVTRNGLAPAADMKVREIRHLQHSTIRDLECSLIDFVPYLETLKGEFEKEGLLDFYIESRLDNGQAAVQYIRSRIEDDSEQPIAILGSYGMGKTTTAKRLALDLAREYLRTRLCRIPIYVELQDISTEQSLEGLLGKVLGAHWPVPNYHFDRLSKLNKSGALVFLFDGFDEMKHAMSWDDFKANFRQLHRLLGLRSKLILLGRPSVFLSEAEDLFILKGMHRSPKGNFREPDWPEYETLSLQPFSADEGRKFIQAFSHFRMNNSRNNDRYLVTEGELEERYKIMEAMDLGEILNRPVQAKMFTELLLDKCVDIKPFTAGELYDIFITRIIERESSKRERKLFTTDQRRAFAQSLAWWLWSTSESMSVDPGKIPDEIFGPYYRSELENEIVRRDLLAACFLDKKSNGHLYFPHRSFQEFLVAEHISGTDVDFSRMMLTISPEIVNFLSGMVVPGFFAGVKSKLALYKAVVPLSLLKATASVVQNGDYHAGATSAWDVALAFLATENLSILIRVDRVFRARQFFSEQSEKLLCVEILLMALDDCDDVYAKPIAARIFAALAQELNFRAGIMIGHQELSKFSLSRYRDNVARADFVYQTMLASIDFQLDTGVDGRPQIRNMSFCTEDIRKELLSRFHGKHIKGADRVESTKLHTVDRQSISAAFLSPEVFKIVELIFAGRTSPSVI